MPICDVTWSQVPGVPFCSRRLRRAQRMSPILDDMVFRVPNHSFRSFSSPSTVATTRAPKAGGLEYMARANAFKFSRTATAESADSVVACTAPVRSEYNPKFFENDTVAHGARPASTNKRNGAASASTSPVANPRYAESKMGTSSFARTTTASSAHCCGVGSMPVGLCAQRCKRMSDPAGAFPTSRSRPSQSRPRPLAST
mmetsp:Transcript_12458/g.41531  ORF Transcript_12458/g.41531 Transcript_12458/m.41531 type:complete len:200 (+) Transcript_12458:268-867(+)